VDGPGPKGSTTRVDRDEPIRPDTSPSTLAGLRPAFVGRRYRHGRQRSAAQRRRRGVVVASAERAAALGRTPLARIVGQATCGLEPRPRADDTRTRDRRLLDKTGWSFDSVDLFEINEAFASQMVAISRELHLDAAKLNVNGGAIALGPPIGASGARVLTTLVHALEARGLRRGVAALCLGGGNGVAVAVER
jgi:acetyl-CoA C-acetyltransferase